MISIRYMRLSSSRMMRCALVFSIALAALAPRFASADVCVSGAGSDEWNGTYVHDVGLDRYVLDGTHVLYHEFSDWVMKNAVGIGNPIAYSGPYGDGVPEHSTYSVGALGTSPAPTITSGVCVVATPTPTPTPTPTSTPTASPTATPAQTATPTPTFNLDDCLLRSAPKSRLETLKDELHTNVKAKKVEVTLSLPPGWTSEVTLPFTKVTKANTKTCGLATTTGVVGKASRDIAVGVALGDANGKVSIEVPEGEYDLTFDYGDRLLDPSTIQVSTDNPIVTQSFDVTAIDLHDAGCVRSTTTTNVKAALDALGAQSRYAVSLYQKYVKASAKTPSRTKAAKALMKPALKIVSAKSAAIYTSTEFPVISLSCSGKPTCTTTKYSTQASKIVVGMKTIRNKTVALAQTAARYVKNVPISTIKKRADKLYQSALKKQKKLPTQSDVCSS